jgi:hypothetical protein
VGRIDSTETWSGVQYWTYQKLTTIMGEEEVGKGENTAC